MSTESATDPSSRDLTCGTVAELLPWLVNGSLAEAEQAAVRAHLATCAGCRVELEETLLAWQILDQHIPSLPLAEYAQGLTPTGPDRERIERHLVHCPSCREELALAATVEPVLDFDQGRRRQPDLFHHPRARRPSVPVGRTGRRPLRAFALAASIAALVGAGSLLWHASGPGFNESEPIERRAEAPKDTTASARDRGAGPDRLASSRVASAVLFKDGFESGSTLHWAGDSGDDAIAQPPQGFEQPSEGFLKSASPRGPAPGGKG